MRVSYLLCITLDVVHAEPAIRNPRARVKPKRTPSCGSWRVPGRSNRSAASWIHKTCAANGRLQVRPLVWLPVALVDYGWEGLCRWASSTTLLALRHKSPRWIGTHGVRVVLPS